MRKFHDEKIIKSDDEVWGRDKTGPLFTIAIAY